MAQWFVTEMGVKAGPFSDDAFFAYLKDKDPARVQIRREGMSAWVPATEIPQLVQLMAPRRRAVRPKRSWLAGAAVIMGLVALAGLGAMIAVQYLDPAYRADISGPPQEVPAAPVEPPQPEPPAAPPPSRLSREQFSDEVRTSMSLLDSLQQRFPKQYEDLVSEFYAKIVDGYPEAETAVAMRRQAFGIIKGLLPLADDDVLLELNKVVGEKYRALNAQNPSLCHAFGTGADSADISATFSDELLRRERDLYERAINTAAPRPAPDARRIGSLQGGLRRALLTRGVTENELGLLDAQHVAPDQHAQYCDVTILLFREIARLPAEDAALVMRRLMAGK